MGNNTIAVNKIPSLTWNWLKMNETDVQISDKENFRNEELVINVPEELEVMKESSDYMDDIAGGMGDEFVKEIHERADGTVCFSAGEGVTCEVPIVISGEYDCGCNTAQKFALKTAPGSEITVLMDFASEKGGNGQVMSQTVIDAGKNSTVRIVQINRLGEGFELFNDIAGVAGKEARIEIVHIFLGGSRTYQGCRINLLGDKSFVKEDIGYFLDNKQCLDMNYVVDHNGKKSESDIRVSGVMEGESEKLFRGTIDFKNGCAGSKGAETEEVILRDDEVINKTIPVILCAEEDVEGSHGATIGRLDEDLIFYMETRGFEEEEIYRLISKTKLIAFCDKIPDEDIRNKTMTFLS